MSPAGRPRKPAAVHKREGTYRPAVHDHDEPVFSKGSPTPPKCLSTEAKCEWKRLVPDLQKNGMYTAADRAIFAAYCQAWADYQSLTVQLNALKSWTFESEKGYVGITPLVTARNKIWLVLKEAAGRFGFDPSSRAGMDVSPPIEGDAQSPEDFLFGKPAGPRLAK